jgi:hypothetical protein
MKIFQPLTSDEVEHFRAWARKHYRFGDPNRGHLAPGGAARVRAHEHGDRKCPAFDVA